MSLDLVLQQTETFLFFVNVLNGKKYIHRIYLFACYNEHL